MEDLCKDCGVTVKRKNYRVHQMTHGDRNYNCYLCAKRFKTRKNLNQHSRTHDKPEEINCNLCNHILHSKSALNKHVRRYHEKKLYSCPYCQKSFTNEQYCKKHIESCKMCVPVHCHVCEKTFPSEMQRNKHLKDHAELQCSVCSKWFQNNKSMLQHRSHVHSNIKERYCQLCNKVFNKKANLMKHMKNIHNSASQDRGFCDIGNGQKVFIVRKECEVPDIDMSTRKMAEWSLVFPKFIRERKGLVNLILRLKQEGEHLHQLFNALERQLKNIYNKQHRYYQMLRV